MTEHAHEDVRRLFDMAMDVPASQREAVLDRECAGDEGLKQRILAMITAAEDERFLGSATGGGLDEVTADSLPEHAPDASGHESVGEQIGRYKLLERIGEGGFGSVWAAEQKEPVKRRVALKIIKLGMDTRQVIARFEAERQALAMMDHPNIARVLDAGSTETGRPYFVMELVKGVPILEYCDTEKLDTKSRLGLFTKVCNAIQHAHQKGIIHRDIKPSNVLVTLHDGVPVPKVIDFGIAKATNQELTEKTVYTQHRQMIGTPAYMSPEQAEMSGLDIDTRSDIYALGVLLYELLTGTTPFDSQSLMEAGFAEMMRIIREDEPHKPSTRLSSLGDTGTRTAEQRRADVTKLSTLLRGDLDWIVMKCLEKDRTRRYETANGLAADINRHLSDEPVLAGPPSTRYRLKKFVKRNRAQVIAGVVVAAALVVAVVGTSTGMVWAFHERDRADTEAANASLAAAAEKEARLDAEASERMAIEEAERAEHELARATEIKRLITEMLQSVDPAVAQTADKTLLLGILDDAAERLKGGEIHDELIAAELHGVVGDVYRNLGLYAQAEEHISVAVDTRTRVLGGEHPDTLSSMNSLASLFKYQGRSAEAEPLLIEALQSQRRVLGEQHPETLRSLGNLANLYGDQARYAEAEPLYKQLLEMMRHVLGEEHPHTLTAMNNLAFLYRNQGRYVEAEPLLIEALESQRRVLGEQHPDTLRSLNNVAALYRRQGRYAEAEPLYLEALAIRKSVQGEEHPATLDSMNGLAILYDNQGRHSEAESLHRETLEISKRVLGEEHPDTLNSMNNLAIIYRTQGRYAEAEPLYVGTLEIRRRVLGEEHPGTLASMNNLANLFRNQDRYAEAEPLHHEALEISRRVLGAEHPYTLTFMNNLANLYKDQGRYAEAESLHNEALENRKRVLGDEHPSTLTSMYYLAWVYREQGRFAEAEPLCLETLEIQRRVLGDEHPDTLASMNNLAILFDRQGRHDEALPLWREQIELQTASADAPDADANSLHNVARALLTHDIEALRDPERALGYAERGCAMEEAAGGAMLWNYLDTLALAQHQTGDPGAAVETQRRAISLVPSPGADPGMHERLSDYEAALSGGGG